MLALLTASPVSAAEYQLVGLYQPPVTGVNGWCRSYEMERISLDHREEYKAKRAEFYARKKGQSPSVHLLGEDAAGVYSYETYSSGFNCTYRVLAVVTANDLDSVEKKMASNVKNHPKSYRSAPELLFEWPGSRYSDVKSQRFDQMNIQFRAYRFQSRNNLHATGVNEHAEKAAVVVFQSPGWSKPKSMLVPPGGKFSMGLSDAEGVKVSVEFIEYAGAGTSLSDQAIDAIAEKIREIVTVKPSADGKPEVAFGSRG